MLVLRMPPKEQAFRPRIADLARLQPGEVVLDVGCGTGTLALEALQRVGATGRVSGIDPSGQKIAHARHKAERAGLSLDFQVVVIEQLVFPDQTFDVVLSTFMMHHLPDDLKCQGLAEIVHVLKPGGHLLVFDMKGPAGPWKSSIRDQPALMKEAGFSQIETGKTRFPGLGFVLGKKLAGDGRRPCRFRCNEVKGKSHTRPSCIVDTPLATLKGINGLVSE